MAQQRDKKAYRHLVPLVWGVLAMVVVVVAMPSALRPPPDEASDSAQFAADAPPTEDPDVIIQSLLQARSATAGGLRTTDPQAADEPAPAAVTTTIPEPEIVVTRGQCYGNPPRQVESLYSGPCVGAWGGHDNGGSTAKGVTADEVRVILWHSGDGAGWGYQGRTPDAPPDNENAAARTLRVFQKYFNSNFEFYGRKLQFIVAEEPRRAESNDQTPNSAHVIGSDEQYDGAFAGWTNNETSMRAAASLGTIVVGGINNAAEIYEENAPYLYGFHMDGDKLVRLNAEYLCKRVAGHPASHAGDPSLASATRSFGLIYNQRTSASGFSHLADHAASRCGLDILAFEMGFGADDKLAGALAQMKLAGVTTVILATDPVTGGPITQAASAQAYFPEWFVSGYYQTDQAAAINLFGYDKSQWSHAFGIGTIEIPGPEQSATGYESTDGFRAYKTIDPEQAPAGSVAFHSFPPLLEIANGVQGAGPHLTVETFRDALFAIPRRGPEPPQWLCCGFGPGDLTYNDLAYEIYWVNEGTQASWPGGYVSPSCFARFGEGEIANGEVIPFRGGCRYPGDGRSVGANPGS